MKNFIIQIVGLSLVVFYGLPAIIPGIAIDGGRAAIIAAVVFAFINFAIKPILRVITLPLNFLSFGLFGLLINVLLFWFVASIVEGFFVRDFIAAFWGAVAMTAASWVLDRISQK